MDWTTAETALEQLRAALETGEPEGAYLTCAGALDALLCCCYLAEGAAPPPLGERYRRLSETRLGRAFLPNLEAYARVCRRLDGVVPGRAPETFPQYSDALRLLDRLRNF